MASNVDQDRGFMGFNGFIWWIGVIENRMDPLKLGRCQIRIAGAHDPDKQLIPTEQLQWAYPLMPLTDSSVLMFKEGDYVAGFYLDGPDCQQPVFIGILPGIPDRLQDRTVGFTDPRTEEELATAPRPPESVEGSGGLGVNIFEFPSAQRNPHLLNEPTTSRLARNENIDETIVASKLESVVIAAPSVDGIVFDEPATPYDAVYPYNKVFETEAGHVLEFDDTFGAERIHIYHRSGTFVEIHPNGTMVTKIGTDGHEYVLGDSYLYVGGNCHISAKGDIRIKAVKDIVMEAENIRMKAATSILGQAGQTVTFQSGVATMIQSGGTLGIESLGPMTVVSASTGIFSSIGPTSVVSGSTLNIFAPGPTAITGMPILLNSGGGGQVPPLHPIPPVVIVPPNVLDVLIFQSQQKLYDMEGPEAPFDGGSNRLNYTDLQITQVV